MFFWLYLYPASIFGGILYSTSVAGWESYALFMWCAIPLHFFITQFSPNAPFGSKWQLIDTAHVVEMAAFALGTAWVWGVVGVPLADSWLGFGLKWFLIVAAFLWGLMGLSMLIGYSLKMLTMIAPRSAVTRGAVGAFFQVGAMCGAIKRSEVRAETNAVLTEAATIRARRIAVSR